MAAENKRHSIGGKGQGGATALNLGPSGPVSLEMALSGAIGARIRITLAPPASTTLEGTLFTACPITNLIAINTAPSSPISAGSGTPAHSQLGDYHIIPISRIQNFQLISLPPPAATPSSTSEPASPFTNAYPSLYALDIRALRNREATAVARLQVREQRRGKGVTKEAQDLFDAFSRTMPARWDGTNIIVADTVIISKPYRVENCRALTVEDGTGLTRVRKVLEMERQKIELRSASAAIGNSGNFAHPNAHTNANANTNTNLNNASTPSQRDRDARAAAVAVPIANNIVRSPPPAGTSGTSQRKGG